MSVKLLIPAMLYAVSVKTIELGDGASFDIELRRPSLADSISALAGDFGGTTQGFRLKSYIKGWSGVEDEGGQPIPYSWEKLNELCTVYPAAVFKLIEAVRGMVSDDEKKLEPPTPSEAGGEATPTEIAATTV